MTRYTVVWWPPVENDLARLYEQSSEKQRIREAADRTDWELARSAHLKGEDVHEGLRALVVDPLVVHFSVDETDRRVVIWSIRMTSD